MQIFSISWPVSLHPSSEDKERFKKVAKNSAIWMVIAVAIRILVPVPGRALCSVAGSTLLAGLTFVCFTRGNYLQTVPEEYPNFPHFMVIFATMVQPYSPFLGITLSCTAGIIRGFYLTRVPDEVEHEMTDV